MLAIMRFLDYEMGEWKKIVQCLNWEIYSCLFAPIPKLDANRNIYTS